MFKLGDSVKILASSTIPHEWVGNEGIVTSNLSVQKLYEVTLCGGKKLYTFPKEMKKL